MARLIEQLQAGYKRHYRPVVAFVVGVIIALNYGVFVERVGNSEFPPFTPVATTTVTIEEATSTNAVGLPRSAPVTLRIPAIDLEAEFEKQLGLNDDGTIEVPDSYEAVGWYQYGPTPGELGPAVVLGHVDSYQGPAVFYSLGQLTSGDKIYIDRADGSVATFIVERLERHEQDDFPTREVYSDLDYAGLRLITCSGIYSRVTKRYSHNLIVFARLLMTESQEKDLQ